MASWTDTGLILGGRRFGEGGLILDVLTETRGRRAGLVYGGASRRRRGQLEAGNTVELAWSGRLEEQLGRFDVAEAVTERAADHLDHPEALAAIGAVTAILRDALEEGDAAGSSMYEATHLLLDMLYQNDVWPALYVRWEMGLLAALGFGLDLSKCAVSGSNDGLTHVSPRTGRAVKGSEAEDYVDRLFVLPPFLTDSAAAVSATSVGDGLHLTGYFLERRLYNLINRPPPEARDLLLRRLERAGLASVPD
ncbi:MAG: DNA repair protein RecO [Pseudomonadota bacterium]